MNRIGIAIFAASLAAAAGQSYAVEFAVNAMDTHVLPVFVQVDEQGKVTRILPAGPLSPSFNRLLDDTLHQWITKPAVVNGHAVASSIILRVSLNVHPRPDGRYNLGYDYVSSVAVPTASASSYWRWTNNDLALVTGPDWRDNRRVEGGSRASYYAAGFGRSAPAARATASAASSSAHGH